jgi:predicted signal transduction protein with EAL and GGDEF domain
LALAERIIKHLRAPFDCLDHRVRIGATIGIASGRPHPEVARSLEDTILVADRAMYAAKERARGTIHHADVVIHAN